MLVSSSGIDQLWVDPELAPVSLKKLRETVAVVEVLFETTMVVLQPPPQCLDPLGDHVDRRGRRLRRGLAILLGEEADGQQDREQHPDDGEGRTHP